MLNRPIEMDNRLVLLPKLQLNFSLDTLRNRKVSPILAQTLSLALSQFLIELRKSSLANS